MYVCPGRGRASRLRTRRAPAPQGAGIHSSLQQFFNKGTMSTGLSETGLRIRREMFGAEFVEQRHNEATDFTRPFIELINNFCFGDVWGRAGLDLKTRSMLTLAMLIALNRPHEIRIHLKGALSNGVSVEEIREILIHATAYCGFPAAFEAFRVCTERLEELDAL